MVRHCAAKRRRAIPRRLVAPVTIRVRGSKGVIVSHVTVGTGIDLARRRHLVRARQSPTRRGVIEGYVGPQRRVMAGGAIGRGKGRSRRRVRRVIRLLPCCQMASGVSAIIRLNRQIVIVVDVAVRAGVDLASRRHLVRVGQRKARRRVVKVRRQPRNCIVASRAGRHWKHRSSSRMLGIRRLLPSG